MERPIETVIDKKFGRVRVTAEALLDDWFDDADYCDFRQPENPEEWLFRRVRYLHSGMRWFCVMDHHGIWRDGRGAFIGDPEKTCSDRLVYSRGECLYVLVRNAVTIRDAVDKYRFLESWTRGMEFGFGIYAYVTICGCKLGSTSFWGFRSDQDWDDRRKIALEVALDACRKAREHLEELVAFAERRLRSGGYHNVKEVCHAHC